jgi:hypothetical protein
MICWQAAMDRDRAEKIRPQAVVGDTSSFFDFTPIARYYAPHVLRVLPGDMTINTFHLVQQQ